MRSILRPNIQIASRPSLRRSVLGRQASANITTTPPRLNDQPHKTYFQGSDTANVHVRKPRMWLRYAVVAVASIYLYTYVTVACCMHYMRRDPEFSRLVYQLRDRLERLIEEDREKVRKMKEDRRKMREENANGRNKHKTASRRLEASLPSQPYLAAHTMLQRIFILLFDRQSPTSKHS